MDIVADLNVGKKAKAIEKSKEEQAEERKKLPSLADTEEGNMEEEIQEVKGEEGIEEEPVAPKPRNRSELLIGKRERESHSGLFQKFEEEEGY